MKLYTIGFTKKSAERFFDLVCQAHPRRLVDVRLHNSSQLAGFAKQDDLAFFLEKLCGVGYAAEPMLAPEAEMLAAYRAKKVNWLAYEQRFLELMDEREVARTLSPELVDGAVLLCSEDQPDRCHRRLVAEYLSKAWGGVDILHLR
ncbi:MAG TPA: DUF488 domain-containing protein [Candidatus Limnocylindrales bacterium]|nr:DUF488 domain-containing protein [Candidatus Limnocylindrales bacterium]